VSFGLGLAVFGVLGLVNRLEPFSTEGQPVLGLSSNGLLSVISLVVGGVLVVSGLRGGRTASTVLVAVGAAFVLSDGNAYRQERHSDDDGPLPLPTTFPDVDDAAAARELAQAEYAVAQHAASPEQRERVAAIGHLRRAEDRVRVWRGQRPRS
jgi:hypothetical protein